MSEADTLHVTATATATAPDTETVTALGSGPVALTPDETVSASEAGRLLGISRTAVVKRIKSGKLAGIKTRNAWEIPRLELDREPSGDVLEAETRNRNPNPSVQPVTRNLKPATEPVTEPVTESLGRNLPLLELEHARRELDATVTEKQVLEVKLGAAEQRAEDFRSCLDRTQAQLDKALTSIESLTDEVKGLTAIVHTRHMLDVSSDEEPRPSVWRRWLGRKKRPARRRQVRIGHA
jgi:excisionase family DNA binding protein